MLDGVTVTPLKRIADERGAVLHMLRADDPLFEGFGEIYFSVVRAGVIKAWKRHSRMIQHFAVPSGNIRLVIFDARNDSPTNGQLQEILTGEDHYARVRIPPGVWYGFQALERDAMIANCASIPHDPAEAENIDLHSEHIPYRW